MRVEKANQDKRGLFSSRGRNSHSVSLYYIRELEHRIRSTRDLFRKSGVFTGIGCLVSTVPRRSLNITHPLIHASLFPTCQKASEVEKYATVFVSCLILNAAGQCHREGVRIRQVITRAPRDRALVQWQRFL